MRKSKVVLLLLMSVLLICFSIGCKSEPSSSKSDKPKPQVTNYMVTFNANGGSGTMPAQVFAQNETKALSANIFTRTDKVFTGWNTKADGTGTPYSDGQSYTATADITLYAQWGNIYTVTFDKNDGSISSTTATQIFKEGQAQNLNNFSSMFVAPAATKFVSWNTSADGTGTEYTDGQSYTATANITLYAQWDFAYLCFTAEAPNSTVSMSIAGSLATVPTFEYSTDGFNWIDFEIGTTTVALANVGDKFYMRGNNAPFDGQHNSDNFLHFSLTGKIAASGNIMSLLDKTCQSKSLSGGSFCFSRLFKSNSLSLTSAPELPATTLSEQCYFEMFYDCRSLTSAPELPATNLQIECYSKMFGNCLALTEPPELPATTLANSCYSSMFLACSSLTEAPELPATTLARNCYQYMFSGCTSLTEAPELPATTLADNCYRYMFRGCTSLTEAPELPSTTLANNCYEQMFKDCTPLRSVKVHFTTWGTTDCTTDWLMNVSSTGTFICPASLPQTRDSSHIPYGWTIETF